MCDTSDTPVVLSQEQSDSKLDTQQSNTEVDTEKQCEKLMKALARAYFDIVIPYNISKYNYGELADLKTEYNRLLEKLKTIDFQSNDWTTLENVQDIGSYLHTVANIFARSNSSFTFSRSVDKAQSIYEMIQTFLDAYPNKYMDLMCEFGSQGMDISKMISMTENGDGTVQYEVEKITQDYVDATSNIGNTCPDSLDEQYCTEENIEMIKNAVNYSQHLLEYFDEGSSDYDRINNVCKHFNDVDVAIQTVDTCKSASIHPAVLVKLILMTTESIQWFIAKIHHS